MCGITGFLSTDNSFDLHDLERMTRIIAHRGPDAEGVFFEEVVGLGHRRLSILDVSSAANQPMLSSDGRYVIVFNGEIYNFKEISKDLELTLRTTSDTEVILEAFAKLKEQSIELMNGMFAFAIYDRKEQELYLVRDRLGVKPLYYYWDGKNLAFASEIKSLINTQLIGKNKQLNKEAINYFLHLGYIPQPHTIYKNIYKFPSGHFAKITTKGIEWSSYWDISTKISEDKIKDFEVAKAEVKSLLISSVKYRMISDVPYGVFLSGGVDSSLITAIATRELGTRVKTFSIGFKESKFNESVYAKRIAEYLNTEHYEFILSQNEAIGLFEKLNDIYDEPFADHSAVPTLMVSKLARNNVKMTLGGDGADELFFGYGSYNWAKRFSNPLLKTFGKQLSGLLSLGNNRYKRLGELLNYSNKYSLKSHIFSQEYYYFSNDEINNILVPDFPQYAFQEKEFVIKRKLNSMEEQSLFDINYYLKDDLLVKLDKASMAASLEVREPFLDYRLVEKSLNIDDTLKVKNGVNKFLVKEILFDYLPADFFKRPKWGFGTPLELWMKNELRYLFDEYLNDEIIKHYQIIKPRYVSALKKRFFAGENYLYMRLWLLIVLHKFLKKNF